MSDTRSEFDAFMEAQYGVGYKHCLPAAQFLQVEDAFYAGIIVALNQASKGMADLEQMNNDVKSFSENIMQRYKDAGVPE